MPVIDDYDAVLRETVGLGTAAVRIGSKAIRSKAFRSKLKKSIPALRRTLWRSTKHSAKNVAVGAGRVGKDLATGAAADAATQKAVQSLDPVSRTQNKTAKLQAKADKIKAKQDVANAKKKAKVKAPTSDDSTPVYSNPSAAVASQLHQRVHEFLEDEMRKLYEFPLAPVAIAAAPSIIGAVAKKLKKKKVPVESLLDPDYREFLIQEIMGKVADRGLKAVATPLRPAVALMNKTKKRFGQ